MSSFIEEIYKHVSPELVSAFGGFKIMLFSSSIAVVEGHRGLKTLSGEIIRLKLRKGFIVIEGESLSISALSKGYAVICGNIAGAKVER
jgi:sporulation protein YqfC